MRVFKLLPMFGALLLAAGCATPVSHYYTLLPEAATAGALPAATRSPIYAISVEPVTVPEQVDRPQIVIGTPGSVALTPLNNSLWVAPLASEVRHALAYDLTQRLGVLDIPAGATPKTLPLWKIGFTIQRFDSIYQQGVVIDASWRLTPVNQPQQTVLICQAEVRRPAGKDIASLVQSHQMALHELAAVIASQLSNQPISPTSAVHLKGCTRAPSILNKG
ncbi:MAG: PqiC family protein [Paralcaligenes sp.]